MSTFFYYIKCLLFLLLTASCTYYSKNLSLDAGHQRNLSHLPLPDKKATLQALPNILHRLRIFYDIQLYDEQYQIHPSQKIKSQIIESSALEFLLTLTLDELERKTAFLEQIIPETNSVIINKKIPLIS